MKLWEELEQEPEYGLLTPEDRTALHDEWRSSILGSLADEDPEAVDAAGVNRFVATERARSQALKTGKPFDPATAEKDYLREVTDRTAAQKQAMKDYDELERARFVLKDAAALRGVTSAGDRGMPLDPRVAEILDRDRVEAQRKLDEVGSRFTPEMLQQVKEVREAEKGERPTAMLGSDLYTDPSLLLDKDKYRAAVAESGASPEAKARAMADFAGKRKQFAENSLRTLRIAGESPIPGAQDFPTWEASQPEDVRRLSPEDKALQYMREMQKRGDIRKLTSAIGTGLLQGGTDIASQGLGVAAMVANSGELAEKAAEVAEGAQTLEEVSKLEGDKQAFGAGNLGGAARLIPSAAATIAPAALTGGASLGVSAALAGAQTAGAQFPNTYTELRKQGMSEQDALNAARNSAIASGIVTAGLTAAFGKTGMEAALGAGAGGKELVKSRLVAAMKGVPKGAVAEIPEELLDEMASQVIEQRTIDPTKPVSQIVDEFAETAPDLAMQIALLGGVGGGIGGYRGSTTEAAQEQEFPAAGAPPDLSQQDRDNFAKGGVPIFDTEGNVTGYTAPRAAEAAVSNEDIRKAAEETIKPGVPVEVEGVTIATIPPGSDMTPDEVLDFANSPEDMAMLARNGKIVLPEVVAPIEGVDPAITDEMNERLAASAALAPQTVEALKAAPAPEVQTETAEPITSREPEAAEATVAETPAEIHRKRYAESQSYLVRDAEGDIDRKATREKVAAAAKAAGMTVDEWAADQAAKNIKANEDFFDALNEGDTLEWIDGNGRKGTGRVEIGLDGKKTVRNTTEGSPAEDYQYTNRSGIFSQVADSLKITPKGKRAAKATPAAAETLGVTPPPAPALEAPEGAARNADMLRQAAARAAGTEQGPRIGFLQSPPAVTTETETPSSTANAAGGSQGVQTESAEGSVPAVTEDTVSISDIPSTSEIQPTQALEPGEESSIRTTPGEESPVISDPQAEWTPTPGQPATANINGQKVVGTVGPSTGKGLVSFQYEWNGKTQKATVRPDRLSRPVASLTEPPSYQYTQEQNTRKMGKHFPVTPGVHANHDFRKSFASMADDTSLSRIYRQIAKIMSKMDAFANIDLHIVADGDIGYAGEYSHSNGKSSIAVNLRQVARGKVDALGTILHEALHHITLAKVRNPQGAFETEVVDKLDTIRKRVKGYAKQQGLGKRLGYEINTLEEFISALTSPDFQNFLASIPDSFSTGVSVNRFRSVLSEVFRLIAELIKGEPVARGSTMEQYFTTVLALFETPHRTLDIGKLEKLSAVQSPAGYRTPTDMLAEAAEKVKGEAVGTKPQGLASMFKPQAKRPATGERKLLDMPVRNNLADAYREAVRGSSTQMAPLSAVYAQARLLQPGLTPEAFLAQVQEGYDNGTLLLEGAGSQQEAAQAGLSLPGTPVGTAVRMMPAPETPKSLVDEETDAAYMAAVEAGDMEAAQRMVDEAAKAAGYGDPVMLSTLDNAKWGEQKQDLDRRIRIAQGNVGRANAALLNPDISPAVKKVAESSKERNAKAWALLEAAKKLGPPPKKLFHGRSSKWTIYSRKSTGRSIWGTDSSEVASTYGNDIAGLYFKIVNPLEVDAQGASFKNLSFEGSRLDADDLSTIAEERGHDGVIIRNFYDSNDDSGGEVLSDHFSVFNPNQIKSADPVVYDVWQGTESAGAKASNLLGNDNDSIVEKGVVSRIHDSQILDPIIESIPVDVMNVFGSKQRATDELLNNPAVFQDALASNADLLIRLPAWGRLRDETMGVVAGTRAELGRAAAGEPALFDRKMFAALDALQNNLVTLLGNLSSEGFGSLGDVSQTDLSKGSSLLGGKIATTSAKTSPSHQRQATSYEELDTADFAQAFSFHEKMNRSESGTMQAKKIIPLSQRFNPESPSILYAAPIDISTLPTREPASGENVPDREAGSSENAETVSQRLESRRKEAISAAVAENDWGNYTREQKVAAAESFLAKWVVSFSAMEFPADVRFSVEVGDGSGAHVSVHEVPSRPLGIRVSVGQNRGLDKYANLSPTEVFAHLYDTAQEESIHVAQYLGMHRDWLEAREQGFKGTFLSYIGQKLKDTFDQINKARIDLQQTDSAAAEKIKDAMLASWNIYHFNDRVEGIAGLWSRLEGDPSRQGDFIMEMVRQLTQLKRQDFTTETGWQKFQRVLKQWLTDAINSLRGVQDVFRSGMAGDLIQRQLADLEAALEGKPLPLISRGTPKSKAEEPDQRESDAILGVMMEEGRFEEGVKMYDKAKRANLGAPPQPSPNTSTPPRFTSPAQFAAAFEAAFLRGDYDYFLEALKQADRHIYVPEMKRYINASKLGDTDAAERLEWFRHAIAGTIPANVKPQAKAPPQPASVGAPTTPPPPTVTPPPKAGASNRPMLTLNTPAMGLIAKMLGASIRINTLLRRARGRIKLSMADGSEIELSKHLFKDPVQAAKTLAHEIGHLFDFLPASGFTKTLAHKLAPLGDFRKVFGNDLADWFMDGGKKIKPSKITQLIKPELVALSKKWRGDFSPSDKYRGSGKELYADFISAILNDPMWTAKNAPYATLGFLNALEQKPEVEQAYQLLVSLVQGGSLYTALAEADQTKSTTALERLIAKSSALMRAKKTLSDATRGLYRSMFGKWLPTAIRDGGIWKSYWNRLKGIGTSKDYNWAQEEASQFAVRQITRFDNDLANAVGIPLKLAGIDPDYLQRLQTNNRIIHERRRVGKLIEEDPVKARALLKWMVDAGLLGKDVQAEVDNATDDELYALTAKVIGMMHANGDSFERALKAARRKGAPADAEKALYAFDVSGFMLNPKVLTMESAEADNADIEQTLGPDQFAELQRINEGYHDLVKRTMVDAYKLGLFRKSTWDDVIEPNFGVYVPFTPIKYFTGHVKGGLGPARVGTAHDLMAPHVVGTLKMHALIRRMQQQKQALLLLDFFNNTGLSNELEPVEDEDFDRIKAEELTKQSKHTISYVPYWEDGEYKWVKVNGTDAVTLMQNSDPDDLAALYKVLRSNTQMWRLNYTIFSIAFNVANTLRNIATPFVDIGPKAGYKAAKQLLSVFPQMAKWAWARIAGKDPASVVAASIAVEHALHKPGMPVSKELQEFYDRDILQPMPDTASLRMSQEELARSVMGAMSSPEFLLQGVHKAAKDMKWYDNTLKQYLHSAVDVMSFIGSVSEAAPKIAAYQALKEKKDSKGKPAFTDAQATYLATLEGIPRPGVAGAHNAALEMVLMFFRVAVQSWRKHLIMATAPQTRAGFLMRHMLFESAKFGLQAMAANGAIDYLIALGAAAAAGGDDDDPEKFKQVDWAEAMDRQSSYKLSHGGIGPLLGWVLPDGSVEPPWGHKSIPADWVPIMPRLPGTELSREADPLAYYVTSKTMAPMIAPVNDDVFWNDFVRSVIPSLNPTFEVASDAMSVLGPTPPRDSYRGREKVEQRLWDEGYIARVMGLGEHHLKSFGLGSNPYDTPLPGVWNVLKQPGVKTLLASDNMVGVRDEQRARHEDDLTSSFAQNMVGEKFDKLKKTFNRLKGKTTPRTKQEEREYEILKPVMSKQFYGTEKRDGLYDVMQAFARMKAKGLQDTPGGKLLKAEAEQATKDLEKIADDLQKPLEFTRTHTLP